MIFWHGIFGLDILAWNFGLKFWPEKNQARNFGLNNTPEFQARNFGLTLTVSLDLRASLPSAPYLTVSFFSSVVSEATYALRLRALEGLHVSLKSPSRVRDGDERVADKGTEEKSVSLTRGHH